MHYHYKPFELLQSHSRQKLEGQIDSFDMEALIRYRDERKPGFHLISHLLYKDESEYLSTFNASKYVGIPELRAKFSELGISLPFS